MAMVILQQQPLSTPFRPWVSQGLRVVVALLIMIPVMMINGGYTGSTLNISSALGVLQEDVMMAYYATPAGMAVAYCFVPYVRGKAPVKFILLMSLTGQIILSLITSFTPFIELIVFNSFLIGFLKGFSLIETIIMINPVFAPGGTRNEFYSKFYPITLSLGQGSLVIASEFAHFFEWQHMYYFMSILLLFALTAVLITMDFQKQKIELSAKDLDLISTFQLSTFLLSLIYVLLYGKTLSWFSSENIRYGTVIAIVTGLLFIHRQLTIEGRPFVDFTLLKNKYSLLAHLFSIFMMFFVSMGILTSGYVNSVLRIGTTRYNELYLRMIPGIIMGGIISYILYRRQVRMAWQIFLGFFCFGVCLSLSYFTMASYGTYEDLLLPLFFRGVGMCLLFVAFSVYSVKNLERPQYIRNAFYIVSVRSTIAPVIGYSILSNWLYYAQIKHTNILSASVDTQNPLAMSLYTSSLHRYLADGLSIEEAKSMANYALYSRVQIQALTVSVKEILGYMLIFCILILIVILLYFFRFAPVRYIETGKDMTE